MKKMFVLVVFVLMLFLALFAGCSEDSTNKDNGGAALSDTDISDVASATVRTGFFPFMISQGVTNDTTYISSSGGIGDDILSGSLVVTDSQTIFTFNTCAVDISGDGNVDITFGGVFSVVGASPVTFTLTDFNLLFTNSETGTAINVLASGTHEVSDSTNTWSGSIILSGITAEPCTVVIEMTMSGGHPVTVTSATINGVDYTSALQTALDNL